MHKLRSTDSLTKIIPNIAIVSDNNFKSLECKKQLEKNYKFVPLEKASIVVVLGGDGFMLKTLHNLRSSHFRSKPVYGINTGTVGFLMNLYQEDKNLLQLIKDAQITRLESLKMIATAHNEEKVESYAINEIYLMRQTNQIAKIRILVNGVVRLEQLVGDGVILATAAGSTAYNLSANGPIIPLDAPLFAMTPICAFRPRRWRGAILPDNTVITFEIIDPISRPVNAFADGFKVENVTKIQVQKDETISFDLLFDPGHNLEERLIKEQFYSE